MNALVKLICLIFMFFSFVFSQEKAKQKYYYYNQCEYDTTFIKKDSSSIFGGNHIKKTRNRAELEVYSDDPYIRTKDCKAIIREINSAEPVFAEYCLQEYYDYAKKQKIPDKWNLRLVKILDTITKIHPYEYEEIRECAWNTSKICSIDIPNKYDSLRNIWTGGIGPGLLCDIENGYILSPEMKNNINKVKEYYFTLKEKFYVGIPYADYWFDIDKKKLESYKSADGNLTIKWTIYGECPPKEDKNKHFFSGKYNIRITGECKEKDLEGIKNE